MPPIPVLHVSLPIFNPAASQSDNPRWKPPVSSFHGNRHCRSWSSPIVEVVLVTSSPNKKVRALLFSYNCTSDARRRSLSCLRRSARFLIPPRCFEGPACRAVDVAVLHYGGYTTPWPWPWPCAPLRRLQETTDGARPHHFQHLQRLSLVFYVGSLERLTAEYIDTIQRDIQDVLVSSFSQL